MLLNMWHLHSMTVFSFPKRGHIQEVGLYLTMGPDYVQKKEKDYMKDMPWSMPRGSKTLALKPRRWECFFVAFESSTATPSRHSHHHCSSLRPNVVIFNSLLHNRQKPKILIIRLQWRSFLAFEQEPKQQGVSPTLFHTIGDLGLGNSSSILWIVHMILNRIFQ